MLAGMYVVHDGTTCQVARISGGTIGYTGPAPVTYALQPVDGGPTRYVDNPKAVDVPLTEACPMCDLPAGFNRCTPDRHDGPRKPREVAPVQPVRVPKDDRCVCARRDCGDCMRRLHAGWRPVRVPAW